MSWQIRQQSHPEEVYHESFTSSRFHLQYHRANSKKNTSKTCKYVLTRFAVRFGQRDLASISQEEVLEFLLSLTKDNRQTTKLNRYSVLASFYNFSINAGLPALTNPCNSSVIRKIFKRPQVIQWNIVDKETVDEISFRTTNMRNRLILELMARGRMRVGEVLNLTPADIQELLKCRAQVSITAGTIFASTNLSMTTWFLGV